MTPDFIVSRGETLNIVISAKTGNPLAVTQVVSKMKKVQIGRQKVMPGDDVPVAATLTVTVLPAATDFLGGWNLALTKVQTAALQPGLYLLDASFDLSSGTIIDGPVLLEVQNSASGA
jgi:hypothetical protein